MTHRVLEGDGLRTSYAFAPRLTSSAVRDGLTTILLEFASSPVYQDGQEFRVTRLDFQHVVGYQWNDFEFHRIPGNSEDVELGLIEIENSSLVTEIVSTGRYVGEPLRHLRITFDDHGTYDIVCEEFSISYGVSVDDALYP